MSICSLANPLLDQDKSSELLRHSPAYEETYVSPSGPTLADIILPSKSNLNRRSVSDPFDEWNQYRTQFDSNLRIDKQSIYGGMYTDCPIQFRRHLYESYFSAPSNQANSATKTRLDIFSTKRKKCQ